MCRSTVDGGRRCPSHRNLEAYNYLRRQRYALKKMATIPATAFQQEQNIIPEHVMFNKTLFNIPANQLLNPQGIVKKNEQLNIDVKRNEGHLVEIEYFADRTVTGTINYNNLDENSYQEFGFKKPYDDEENFIRRSDIELDECLTLSEAEIEPLTSIQSRALNMFTTKNYRWINKALYNRDSDHEEYMKRSEELSDFLETTTDDGEYSFPLYGSDTVTTSMHDNIVSHIDAALDKAPKKQRIVYRGETEANGGTIPSGNRSIKEWLEQNIEVGKEVKFDGYQSTTADYSSAQHYARSPTGGVIYEILTPEGINVTSVSRYEEEKEILLPRQARYMVVGIHKNVIAEKGSHPVNIVQMVAINEQGAVLDGTNSTPLTPSKL
jgi:hypothetical protein